MSNHQGNRAAAGRKGASRRDFLRLGTLGVAGLTLSSGLRLHAGEEPKKAKAKSVIELWMAGGPPQTDTFDPKPEAGEDYCGPWKNPVQTNVPGIRIGEMLPLLAKQADKYSIIRSFTHSNDGHETAAYIVLTGTLPTPEVSYPAMGAVVGMKKSESEYKGSLPSYIMLTSPLGRFSAEGFLGAKYRPFVTGGDPNQKEFRVAGLMLAKGAEKRLEERRALLESVDAMAKDKDKELLLDSAESYKDKAYSLILGDSKKAFDLSEEKDDLRDRYGRNQFGQSCLAARRLVENGVPFVTINYGYGNWDTHNDNFGLMKKTLPVLDGGFATLLDDLAQRGLLESTIVVWYGEFGRTPKISNEPPWFGGRHHYGRVFSAVVAGGGFKGGTVVGASDEKGERVKDRPVYPWDLTASMYKLLGIDYTGRLPHPQGCVAYVSPLANGSLQGGGLLTEIM